MRNLTPVDDGFFYFENGQGAYVLQPKKIMGKVRNYVAPNFRTASKDRYDLYLVKQASNWPDVLYLFDEWNAYIAGARSTVEMIRANQWDKTDSDPFDGLADFLYFCSASILALKEFDPEYLKTNEQFKAVFSMLTEQSVYWIEESKKMPEFKNSRGPKKLKMQQEDAENQALRNALVNYLN
jgi:hypothetical protein